MWAVDVKVGSVKCYCQFVDGLGAQADASKALSVEGLADLDACEVGVLGAIWILWDTVAEPEAPIVVKSNCAWHQNSVSSVLPYFQCYMKQILEK